MPRPNRKTVEVSLARYARLATQAQAAQTTIAQYTERLLALGEDALMSTKTYTFTVSINDADGTFLEAYGRTIAEDIEKAIDEQLSDISQQVSPQITGFTTRTEENTKYGHNVRP